MVTEQAYIAAIRLSYGPRPDDLKKMGTKPKCWLPSKIGYLSVPKELRQLESSPVLLSKMFRQQGRDSRPTIEGRALITGVPRDHLKPSEGHLEDNFFPNSGTAAGLPESART